MLKTKLNEAAIAAMKENNIYILNKLYEVSKEQNMFDNNRCFKEALGCEIEVVKWFFEENIINCNDLGGYNYSFTKRYNNKITPINCNVSFFKEILKIKDENKIPVLELLLSKDENKVFRNNILENYIALMQSENIEIFKYLVNKKIITIDFIENNLKQFTSFYENYKKCLATISNKCKKLYELEKEFNNVIIE